MTIVASATIHRLGRGLARMGGRLWFKFCLWMSRHRALRKVFDWCQKGQPTRDEIEHALRLGPVLHNIACSFVAPIYWLDPAVPLQEPPLNGTIFFINTGQRTFAVTADHVYSELPSVFPLPRGDDHAARFCPD